MNTHISLSRLMIASVLFVSGIAQCAENPLPANLVQEAARGVPNLVPAAARVAARAVVTNGERALAAAKLIGSGLVAGAATVIMDKKSPQMSNGGIFITLTGATIAAARTIFAVDINRPSELSRWFSPRNIVPELNWVNAITFGLGLATYGIYKKSDKLVEFLKRITDEAARAA